MNIRELWTEVPGTDGRLEVSNLGRLMYLGVLQSVEYDVATKTLGWRMQRYGRHSFVPRVALMALFMADGIPIKVDTSGDEEAKESAMSDLAEAYEELKGKSEDA